MFLSLQAFAQSPDVDLTQRLDDLISANSGATGHPVAGLAVTVFAEGRIIYRHGTGRAVINPESPSHERPMTPDTPVRIASISKLVAAIGAMVLVDKGTLDLDADISTYLGADIKNPHHPNTPITTRMLLSHTSSIRDGDGYAFPLGTRLLEELNDSHFADHVPGTYFSYSNLNFGLLAQVMEAVSALRFDRFMTDQVLSPLGLDAGYNLSGMSPMAKSRVGTLYRKRKNDVWDPRGPWYPQVDDFREGVPDLTLYQPEDAPDADLPDYKLGTNGSLFSPQGGLRASTDDLAVIGQMLLNGGIYGTTRILSADAVRQMWQPEWLYTPHPHNGDTWDGVFQSYGLSTHRLLARTGDQVSPHQTMVVYGHSGDAYGLLSGLWFSPQANAGFAFVITGVAADPEENKGRTSALFGHEEDVMTAITETVLKGRFGRPEL